MRLDSSAFRFQNLILGQAPSFRILRRYRFSPGYLHHLRRETVSAWAATLYSFDLGSLPFLVGILHRDCFRLASPLLLLILWARWKSVYQLLDLSQVFFDWAFEFLFCNAVFGEQFAGPVTAAGRVQPVQAVCSPPTSRLTVWR